MSFNVLSAMKYADNRCFSITSIDEKFDLQIPENISSDDLADALLNLDETDEDEVLGYIQYLEAGFRKQNQPSKLEELKREKTEKAKASIEELSTLELKPLPAHLKYAYLGEKDTLPIIMSNALTSLQEEKLLRVLREHKRAIGWTMAEIKGIKPTFC